MLYNCRGGCATTGSAEKSNTLPDTIVLPKMEKKFVKDSASNPLKSTNVKGIYVINPYESMADWLKAGYDYEIELLDKNTGDVLYTIENVIIDWTSASGWNGQIQEGDLAVFTNDATQYFIKKNKFNWRIVVEEGFVTPTMDNPLTDTETESIYTIKPAQTKNLSNKIKSENNTYKIEVYDRSTKSIVKTFNNVVDDWQGMTGWNGKVEAVDYTFITKDKIQYIVKGNKYYVMYEVSYYNPTKEEIQIKKIRHNDVFASVKPGETVTKKIQKGDQYCFYTDGGRILVDLTAYNGNTNFILGVEKPEIEKKYLCLNQFKENSIEQSGDYYALNLFEVVDEKAENAYKYSDDTYIRSYPSACLWFNDFEYVKRLMGTVMVYSNDWFGPFNLKSDGTCWGWSTYKDKKTYMHIITKQFYLKK